MGAVLSETRESIAEGFREPNQTYLSARRVGDALGLQVQSVAERARVSRNIPSVRPQNEALQAYLRDVTRVLTAATELTGGDRSRAVFWFMNEPLAEFDYQTPDELVKAGKAQIVVDYVESISSGFVG